MTEIREKQIVFVPETKEYARVICVGTNHELPHRSSAVRVDGRQSFFWQNDENLIPLIDDCDPKTLIEDHLRCNVLCIIAKIAGFLWRRIVAIEGKDKAHEEEIKSLKQTVDQLKNELKLHSSAHWLHAPQMDGP